MVLGLLKTKAANADLVSKVEFVSSADALTLKILGDWNLKSERMSLEDLCANIKKATPKKLSVDCSNLQNFDSSFIFALYKVYDFCKGANIEFDIESLCEKPKALLKLAIAVPANSSENQIKPSKNVFVKVHNLVNDITYEFKEQFRFVGELILIIFNPKFKRPRFRFSDLAYEIQRAGPDALGIVGLISFLVGLILAFVGAIQLAKYGSEVYVADLVGLAMVREMGVIMVGVAMAGRTGAAYAAELGSMKINEEISAFRTFGISPMEFLVIPRILALVMMFPLLTVFADFIGMIGGFAISWSMFDINYDAYMGRTFASLNLEHCFVGVFKSVFFGIIVAIVGCMKGMTCGKNAAAVGNATTSSVVTSITLIIVADALFAAIFNIFDI